MNHSSNQLYWDTIDYWDEWREKNNAGEDELLAGYIRNLLPKEMAGRPLPQQRQTLAMLVGHAVEPLLQTVYWYRPTQIYLLFNDRYTALTKGDAEYYTCIPGEMFVNTVKRAIEKVVKLHPGYPSGQVVHVEPVPLDSEQPDDVFAALLKNVGSKDDLVIDMTGAKKSMVAGAFLYAAFTYTKVSYVNFPTDAYNPEYGRPYGFTSRIELVENPYTSFALREWEQLRQAYVQHNFQQALQLLHIIKQAKPFISLPAANDSLEKLEEVLSAYAHWDRGDYHAACRAMKPFAETIRFEDNGSEWHFAPPVAVTRLGENFWPKYGQTHPQLVEQFAIIQTGTPGNPSASLLLKPNCFAAYVEDELAKIKRLCDIYEDYRSVMLRAAGLNEVLLKARLAALWQSGDKSLAWYWRKSKQDPWVAGIKPGKDKDRFFRPLVKKMFRDMFSFLTDEQGLILDRDKTQKAVAKKTMESYWQTSPLHPEILANLRNQAIHVFLSVSRDIAGASIDLAKMNWNEYLENWANEIGKPQPITAQQVTAVSWGKICRGCGLDQFLPPNLLKEV